MHRDDIDALKGISIIAVVLFHIGLLKSGYLGVDAFFVINGFLVIPSIINKIESNKFSYLGFIAGKTKRLLPLIVLASIASLVLGYFLMLPDHYENLAESVIAGNLMSENILSAITTKNYWDVSNEFKPLMHLWYVGILFEFYLILPLVLLVVKYLSRKLKRNVKSGMITSLHILSTASLLLYLLPIGSIGDKFYYLPYRFFELGIGGIVAISLYNIELGKQNSRMIQKCATLLLISFICCSIYCVVTDYGNSEGIVIGKELSNFNGLPFSSTIALVATVVLATIVVSCKNGGSLILKSRILVWIGRMSYSIFIWHQVLLAFYRYSISYEMTPMAVLVFIAFTMLVSSLSYYLIEKKINATNRVLVCWIVIALLVILPSTYLYIHAGVVRDVPELNVVKGTEHRGMFGEYCDRVYKLKDFPKDKEGRLNVLVVGVSYGRDFANILLESKYKDSINLTYAYKWSDKDLINKIKVCDYIFSFSPYKIISKEDYSKIASLSVSDGIPYFVFDNMPNSCKMYGIGTKNYGNCNGIIYKNRYRSDYYAQTAILLKGYMELNEEWKAQWGDNYVDLLTPALMGEKSIRVFTDNNKFISQDCSHLVQEGARWYARILDFDKIFDRYQRNSLK